jgi:hypothetical protein
MTTTPTPSPEAEALPTLPVVASREDFEAWARPYLTCDPKGVMGNYDPLEWVVDWNGREHYYGQDASRMWDSWQASRCAPAEAAIVALRAERDEWHLREAEAQTSLEDYKSSFWKAAELRDALRTVLEIIGLGDSSNPQVDAADTLVELGLWRREAVDEMRAARASLLGDGGTL